ncbi:carboxypeptidase-like regulatory domain-containing protein [Algoriphagus sp. NF]|uniref:carboxypeptidase-like regulatory domain-containing protein n=1 Tax=Algoriphagus sp. NF TaxID=2992756 RepID=UPI00237A2C34|nr:carboxypeptidase-like regulatory domain-containing protein [Algoriphagus sp. NF]MDE0558347.1 carboxypeptidase-like regulatory domain-containing protein [Algoriphagus sp. NF]
MKWIYVLLFTHIISFAASSQQILKGRILEPVTESPIPYATVYLANTTLGTTADENGVFSMEIPSGSFEVIVRMLGYESATFSIQSNRLPKPGYIIFLKPSDTELNEIEVEDERDPSWYKNLQTFKLYFLGNSKNASKAKIENEKVLRMDDQSQKGILRVTATKNLKIHNPNLGYYLDFQLEEFQFRSRGSTYQYAGYPLFTEEGDLSKSRLRKIQKNRLEAYQGSLQHLIRSLHQGIASEEGFEIRRLHRIPNPDKPADSLILQAKKQYDSTSSETIKSILKRDFLDKESLPDSIDQLEKSPIDPKILLSRDSENNTFLEVDFALHVTFKLESEPREYLGQNNPKKPGPQISTLYFQNKKLQIFENGSYPDPFAILIDGYMGWKKVADLMPLDYLPPN